MDTIPGVDLGQEADSKEVSFEDDTPVKQLGANEASKEEEKVMTEEEKFEYELSLQTPQHQELIRKGREACVVVEKSIKRTDWKQILEKEGVKVFQFDVPGGKKCTMGQGYIDFTPEQIFEFLKIENI